MSEFERGFEGALFIRSIEPQLAAQFLFGIEPQHPFKIAVSRQVRMLVTPFLNKVYFVTG